MKIPSVGAELFHADYEAGSTLLSALHEMHTEWYLLKCRIHLSAITVDGTEMSFSVEKERAI
jgi:hypothetical protein